MSLFYLYPILIIVYNKKMEIYILLTGKRYAY